MPINNTNTTFISILNITTHNTDLHFNQFISLIVVEYGIFNKPDDDIQQNLKTYLMKCAICYI